MDTTKRIRVIILYNKLFHYRIPIWNLLAEKCDLTVAYSEGDGKIPKGLECKFSILSLPARTLFNRFVIQRDNIRKLAKNYDVIIAYGNIAWLKYSTLPWFNNVRIIFHTIGVSASYEKGFDQHNEWDRIRAFFYSKASALLFYTSYPFAKYERMGIGRDRMFEAPNTVEVRPYREPMNKDSILFIGTLYRQKGLQTLLDAYSSVCHKDGVPKLRIIGNGPDSDEIREWIDKNNMGSRIEMLGAIYDIEEKARFFARAYACISPRQAGLSVLESMGYGVPFITSNSAITGGELLNIHDGIDGIVMENEGQLCAVIEDIAKNKEKYIRMGENARSFYIHNRTPQHMADGMWKAIQYAIYH